MYKLYIIYIYIFVLNLKSNIKTFMYSYDCFTLRWTGISFSFTCRWRPHSFTLPPSALHNPHHNIKPQCISCHSNLCQFITKDTSVIYIDSYLCSATNNVSDLTVSHFWHRLCYVGKNIITQFVHISQKLCSKTVYHKSCYCVLFTTDSPSR